MQGFPRIRRYRKLLNLILGVFPCEAKWRKIINTMHLLNFFHGDHSYLGVLQIHPNTLSVFRTAIRILKQCGWKKIYDFYAKHRIFGDDARAP